MFRSFSHVAHAAVLLCCASLLAAAPGEDRTALDEYIAAPDPSYAYQLVRTVKEDGLTTYVIEMTSQTWLTTKEVDRPVWTHWVILVKPDEVKSTKGLLYISGGGWCVGVRSCQPVAAWYSHVSFK